MSAVDAAKSKGAGAVLHCGDLVSPWVLKAIETIGLPVHLIHGNNAGDLVMLTRMADRHGTRLRYYGQDATLKLAGRRIFLVHFPHYARAMAAAGDWDLVCFGHTHKAMIEDVPNLKGGRTALVNPGTVAGVDAPATYAFGDLGSMTFEILEVP